MKSKIVRDIIWDAIISIFLVEGVLFGVNWGVLTNLETSNLALFFENWYIWIALGLLIIIATVNYYFYLLCMKRYKQVISERGVSDEELYNAYKNADKCCQFRVNSPYVFVNTSHGIICMTKDDIIEKNRKRVRHIRNRTKSVHGNVKYRERRQEYFTYHFTLKTNHGTFKSNVKNDEVLDKLQDLFN